MLPKAKTQRMMREVWLLSRGEEEVRLSVAAAKDWLTGIAWV